MLTAADYDLTQRSGVFTCAAKTPAAVAAVRGLQTRLRQLAPELAAAGHGTGGAQRVVVDGRVGPTTATAARALLAAVGDPDPASAGPARA